MIVLTIKELAHLLNLYYEIGVKNNNVSTMLVCFGIKYASIIKEKNYQLETIFNSSSVDDAVLAKDVRTGMELSYYVQLKDGVLFNTIASMRNRETSFDEALDWVETKLRTVGKKSFICHLYPELKNNIDVTVEEVAAKYSEFRAYELNSQNSKLSTARTIFKNGKVEEALKNIMCSENLSIEIRKIAEQYYLSLLNTLC
jgi:hypothetical protein